LYDPNDPDTYYSDYVLGNISSYSLTSLPEGFLYGVQYRWKVDIFGENYGFGVSNTSRKITFNPGH
jgi:hypothetical protein